MVEKIKQLFPKHSIWFFALGYFLVYVPNTMLTKMITLGEMPNQQFSFSGISILPLLIITATITMVVSISILGWWKYIQKKRILGLNIPMPRKVTLISGLLSSGVIVTTIMAYSFKGVSIVLMVLLMKGGVLVLAPVIDTLNKRHKEWNSWVALGLSIAALLVAFLGKNSANTTLSTIAIVDVLLYLSFYFFRLQFMSKYAKSRIPFENRRYFVEEQMIAAPAMLILLAVAALLGNFVDFNQILLNQTLTQISWGFTKIFSTSVWGYVCLIGIFSQLAGLFGGLILLDKRANSFSVPVNRSASILAGVSATFFLSNVSSIHAPSLYQLLASAMVIIAILFLTLPQKIERFFILRTPDTQPQQSFLRAELLQIATQKAIELSTQARHMKTQKIRVKHDKYS